MLSTQSYHLVGTTEPSEWSRLKPPSALDLEAKSSANSNRNSELKTPGSSQPAHTLDDIKTHTFSFFNLYC